MNPIISVVIPTYNRSGQVKKAIESVLNQTYKDFEIIVVDDGSTDDTKTIIDDLINIDIRIIYIFQSNQGSSAARNIGIQNSTGKYISFLDSDDLFLPEKLEIQYFEMENKPSIGMSFTWTCQMDEIGKINWSDNNSKYLSGSIYPKMLSIKNNIIMTPSVMVRKKVIEDVGDFNVALSMCEDLDLWRRIAMKYPVLQIQKTLSVICIRKKEHPDYPYFLQARKTYYELAFSADEHLNQEFKNGLLSEMYAYYGTHYLRYNISWGLKAIGQSIFITPKYILLQIIDGIISFVALFLKTILPVSQYNQIKSIYHRIIQVI